MELVDSVCLDCERTQVEIEAAKKALGDFAKPPFDGSLAGGIDAISMRCAAAEREVERLRKGVECHVARPGEGTYECNIEHPCPACRLRVAEVELAEAKMLLRSIVVYRDTKWEKKAAEWLATRTSPLRDGELPEVGGRFCERSLAAFERAVKRCLQVEQEKLSPDNALIAVLCDAVRLARENEQLSYKVLTHD